MTRWLQVAPRFIVLLSLLCATCQNTFERNPSPCAGEACSDHGECFTTGDGTEVFCECDQGFHAQGMECLPDGSDGDADVDGDTDVDGDQDASESPDADGDADCVPECSHRSCGLDPRCGVSCGECSGGVCCDGRCHVGGNCCTDEECSLCVGLPPRCESLPDPFRCLGQPGCDWIEQCEGLVPRCRLMMVEDDCARCGCTFVFDPPMCQPSDEARCDFMDFDLCEECGCRWFSFCGGVHFPCQDHTSAEVCRVQEGCHWASCVDQRCQ